MNPKIISTYTIVNWVILLLLMLLTWQCANKLSIEGGPKDEQPPVLDLDNSDNNFQTQFQYKEFRLAFDEFVTLDKPGEQIVVSPPLQYSLTPVPRGKHVIFRFHPEEKLLDQTTYTIQFGEAIQDITEGNAIKNLRYVFSTGDHIDSMKVSVRVVNMMTNAPEADVLVMLYETMSDTMIRKGRPTYFSKTDSAGLAHVENTKPGAYRVFALRDENRNYQLDLAEEQLAHMDTMVQSEVSPATPHLVYLYKEIEPPYRQDVRRLDSLTYAFVMAGESAYVEWIFPDSVSYVSYQDKDTIFIRLNNFVDSVILDSPYEKPDTIRLTSRSFNKNARARFSTMKMDRHQSKILKHVTSVDLFFNNPISQIDGTQFRVLTKDSVLVDLKNIVVDSTAIGTDQLALSYDGRGMRDSLILFPGAVSSWYATNDTVVVPLRSRRAQSLSNLIVEAKELDPAIHYLIRVKDRDGRVIQKTVLIGEEEQNWNVKGLFPKKHVLELISDVNNNGIRDGGWFDFRQMPEAMIVKEIDNLRADWDVQIEIQPN